MNKGLLKLLTGAVCAFFGIIILFLCFKFILPWTAPFILAYITAAVMEPGVGFVSRRTGIKRWAVSGVMTALLFALLFFVCKALVIGISRGAADLLEGLPGTLRNISSSLEKLDVRVSGYISSAPAEVREYLDRALSHLTRTLDGLPGDISSAALKYITRAAAHMPKILLFTVTYGVGTVFISSRLGEVRDFLLRQIPEKHRRKAEVIKSGILGALGKWLRAQLMLLGVTFLELTAGFTFLRVPHPLLIAFITSVIDALPVLGVGTVLLPWSLYSLLTGSSALALGLLVLYIAVTMIRSLLEPKLVSGQLGLHPVAALMAIYVGFSSIGVPGMILFPAGLLILKKLNDEEIVRLWK